MKLSKEQKKILKSIPNKKIRLEQKLQFKIQNKKENQPLNLEPLYAVDLGNGATLFRRKWKLAEQPENHNSTIKTGFMYKGKMFDTLKEALEYAPISETTLQRIKEIHKNFMELANIDFNIKVSKIISEEKAKELFLNNGYLQKVLSETHDVKFFRDLQRICVKCQNYEYATKFRQKVWDILDTLDTEKLMELVKNGTIELSDMLHAVGRKTNKFANDSIGTAEFTKEKYAPKNPLTIDQIETVIDWMNTWEQLKDTVIPIRFKEDFNLPKKENNMFSWYKGEFANKENTFTQKRPLDRYGKKMFSNPNNFLTNCEYQFLQGFIWDNNKQDYVPIKFNESANDNPKQFTLEDMRKAYFTAVIDYLKTDNGKREYNGEILFNKFTESLINT